MELEKIIGDMVFAAIEASELIKDIYNSKFDVTYKDDDSPLTTADIAANSAITARLKMGYPHLAILTEEDEDSLERLSNTTGVFIIDPLDGTMEFVNRNGEFCVSIALAVQHRVVAAAIAVPMKNEIYYAAHGKGAYKTDFASINEDFVFGLGTKLSVSDRTDGIIVALSRSHGDKKTEIMLNKNKDRIASTVTVGSCLKGCMIAEGLADVHYRFGPGTKEWDTAGMQIICEEAGAIFTDIYGQPLSANRDDPHNRDGFIILNSPKSALDISDII